MIYLMDLNWSPHMLNADLYRGGLELSDPRIYDVSFSFNSVINSAGFRMDAICVTLFAGAHAYRLSGGCEQQITLPANQACFSYFLSLLRYCYCGYCRQRIVLLTLQDGTDMPVRRKLFLELWLHNKGN